MLAKAVDVFSTWDVGVGQPSGILEIGFRLITTDDNGDDSPGSGAATPVPAGSASQGISSLPSLANLPNPIEALKIAIPPPGPAPGQTLNERAKEK